jgi:uncharacterized damage-inducible protein DinB
MTGYSGPDLARSFRVVRKNTLAIAREIPEAKYSYRATPDTRTVGETLAHIAALSRWPQLLHAVDKKTFVSFEDFGRYLQENGAYEATLKTPADIIQALESNGRHFADWLEAMSPEALAERVAFPPPSDPSSKTRFEMLLGVKEHEMHHRAQLMLVQRLLGIVPHLTRERQARAAAAAAPQR